MKNSYWAYVIGGVIVIVLIVVAIRSKSGQLVTSQDALERAVANMLAADRYHVSAELQLDLPSQRNPAQLVDVTMRTEGDVEETEDGTLYGGNLFVEAKGRGLVLFTEGELRLLPDSVAFKLDSLPALLNPEGTLANKWTYVDSPVLHSNNSAAINEAILNVSRSLQRRGSEEIPGGVGQGIHYQGQLTADQEDQLIAVLQQSVSGSRAWNVIARLLKAFDLNAIDVWVQENGVPQLRHVKLTFEKADIQNDEAEAVLVFTFGDFGKDVAIEAPDREITVSSEVFTRLFGEGEVTTINQEQSDEPGQ
ncbi:MAG: hypothetical protein WD200_00500 [Candidatus Andersenbacteria bacterium]